MKNNKMLFGVLGVLLLLTAIAVGFVMSRGSSGQEEQESLLEEGFEELPEIDERVSVDVSSSATEDNTVVITVDGLDGAYSGLIYELTYDSEGLIKGINSGTKPLDISGQDSFNRDDIFLGTCSRNVCTADEGVVEISLVLQLVDTDGKKSQFTGDFTL